MCHLCLQAQQTFYKFSLLCFHSGQASRNILAEMCSEESAASCDLRNVGCCDFYPIDRTEFQHIFHLTRLKSQVLQSNLLLLSFPACAELPSVLFKAGIKQHLGKLLQKKNNYFGTSNSSCRHFSQWQEMDDTRGSKQIERNKRKILVQPFGINSRQAHVVMA